MQEKFSQNLLNTDFYASSPVSELGGVAWSQKNKCSFCTSSQCCCCCCWSNFEKKKLILEESSFLKLGYPGISEILHLIFKYGRQYCYCHNSNLSPHQRAVSHQLTPLGLLGQDLGNAWNCCALLPCPWLPPPTAASTYVLCESTPVATLSLAPCLLHGKLWDAICECLFKFNQPTIQCISLYSM